MLCETAADLFPHIIASAVTICREEACVSGRLEADAARDVDSARGGNDAICLSWNLEYVDQLGCVRCKKENRETGDQLGLMRDFRRPCQAVPRRATQAVDRDVQQLRLACVYSWASHRHWNRRTINRYFEGSRSKLLEVCVTLHLRQVFGHVGNTGQTTRNSNQACHAVAYAVTVPLRYI